MALKNILLWDVRFPDRSPRRIILEDALAAPLIAAGVAADGGPVSVVASASLAALGPTAASFTIGAAAGTTIAAITGLGSNETLQSVSPNDDRVSFDVSRRNLVIGLTASGAGLINYVLTTSLGRTLPIAVTANTAVPSLPKPILLVSNDTITGATTASGQPAPVVDTVNKKQGAASLRGRGNGVIMEPYIDFPIDVAKSDLGDVVAALIYIRSSRLVSNINVGFRPMAGGVDRNGGASTAFGAQFLHKGWYMYPVPLSLYSTMAPRAPTDRYQGVRQYLGSSSQPREPNVNLDAVYANARGRPTIFLTFDDSYGSQYSTAFPLLEARGLKANFNVNQDYIESGSTTKLNIAKIREMYAAGHDITVNPLGDEPLTATSLPTGSPSVANAVANMQQTRQWLIANGMPRGADFGDYSNGQFNNDQYEAASGPVAFTSTGNNVIVFGSAPSTPVKVGMTAFGWPFPDDTKVTAVAGDGVTITLNNDVPASNTTQVLFVDETTPFYGDKLTTALRAAGFKLLRATSVGLSNQSPIIHSRFGFFDFDLQLPAQATGSGSTLAALTAHVDNCIAMGGTMGFYTHGVEGTGASIHTVPATYSGLLDYLVAKRDAGLIDILTLSQLWARDGAATLPA